jgi:NADH-quinone oxidoreductase subunit J
MEFAIFAITSIIALMGGIMMLVSRNAVHSALYLLLNFGAIAILYLLLLSPFLFAVQLAVYAGAIVVLFLFVVMLLGAERAEDDNDALAWQKPLALILGLVLLGQAIFVAIQRTTTLPVPAEANFGSPTELATLLFTDYLLPVEVTSVILLVAMVGVVVLNKVRKERGA